MNGFSRRNLYAMKQWYEFYSQHTPIVPQTVAQLPWGHNRLIIGKIKDISTALFYSEEAVKGGWSRDLLEAQIESNLIASIQELTVLFEGGASKY